MNPVDEQNMINKNHQVKVVKNKYAAPFLYFIDR